MFECPRKSSPTPLSSSPTSRDQRYPPSLSYPPIWPMTVRLTTWKPLQCRPRKSLLNEWLTPTYGRSYFTTWHISLPQVARLTIQCGRPSGNLSLQCPTAKTCWQLWGRAWSEFLKRMELVAVFRPPTRPCAGMTSSLEPNRTEVRKTALQQVPLRLWRCRYTQTKLPWHPCLWTRPPSRRTPNALLRKAQRLLYRLIICP